MKKKRSRRHYSTMWLHPDDAVPLVVATATVAAILLSLFILIPDFQPSSLLGGGKATSVRHHATTATTATATADKMRRAEEQTLRTSSIIFVSPNSQCEERRFDNATGRMLSIKDVDCDARLNRLTPAEEKEERTANIRSVLTSFRK